MTLKFKFNPIKAVLLLAIIVLAPFFVSAEDVHPSSFSTISEWLTTNWAIVALVLSESLALLPSKMHGIIQSILKIGGLLFKKKSASKFPSS